MLRSWESIGGAATAFNRLRTTAHGWGEPGAADDAFIAQCKERVEDDLNMPRVLALCWDLVASDLPDAVKKATLLHFDQIMGLGLAEWAPQEEEIPAAIQAMAATRQQARADKDWAIADQLRDELAAAASAVRSASARAHSDTFALIAALGSTTPMLERRRRRSSSQIQSFQGKNGIFWYEFNL